mmetsp:Transcript_39147/g.90596  ORF Transcript_39147/g.90596 Transcript_39147/m.90596 type:complete len:201 (+) Transcript_39147:273-875(+)
MQDVICDLGRYLLGNEGRLLRLEFRGNVGKMGLHLLADAVPHQHIQLQDLRAWGPRRRVEQRGGRVSDLNLDDGPNAATGPPRPSLLQVLAHRSKSLLRLQDLRRCPDGGTRMRREGHRCTQPSWQLRIQVTVQGENILLLRSPVPEAMQRHGLAAAVATLQLRHGDTQQASETRGAGAVKNGHDLLQPPFLLSFATRVG